MEEVQVREFKRLATYTYPHLPSNVPWKWTVPCRWMYTIRMGILWEASANRIPHPLYVRPKVPVRPKAWTCKRCRGFWDRMKLIGTWEWWWWWWMMMDDGQRGSMHDDHSMINDDQWWSTMVHVGYIHTIIIYLFEVIYCFSCRYFKKHFAQKLFWEGESTSLKKVAYSTMQPNHAGTSFWGFVPAWTDTTMFSRYIQTRPCKVFSVPTTLENDWNLKIQTSPQKGRHP